jgi:hypothetical protein
LEPAAAAAAAAASAAALAPGLPELLLNPKALLDKLGDGMPSGNLSTLPPGELIGTGVYEAQQASYVGAVLPFAVHLDQWPAGMPQQELQQHAKAAAAAAAWIAGAEDDTGAAAVADITAAGGLVPPQQPQQQQPGELERNGSLRLLPRPPPVRRGASFKAADTGSAHLFIHQHSPLASPAASFAQWGGGSAGAPNPAQASSSSSLPGGSWRPPASPSHMDESANFSSPSWRQHDASWSTREPYPADLHQAGASPSHMATSQNVGSEAWWAEPAPLVALQGPGPWASPGAAPEQQLGSPMHMVASQNFGSPSWHAMAAAAVAGDGSEWHTTHQQQLLQHWWDNAADGQLGGPPGSDVSISFSRAVAQQGSAEGSGSLGQQPGRALMALQNEDSRQPLLQPDLIYADPWEHEDLQQRTEASLQRHPVPPVEPAQLAVALQDILAQQAALLEPNRRQHATRRTGSNPSSRAVTLPGAVQAQLELEQAAQAEGGQQQPAAAGLQHSSHSLPQGRPDSSRGSLRGLSVGLSRVLLEEVLPRDYTFSGATSATISPREAPPSAAAAASQQGQAAQQQQQQQQQQQPGCVSAVKAMAAGVLLPASGGTWCLEAPAVDQQTRHPGPPPLQQQQPWHHEQDVDEGSGMEPSYTSFATADTTAAVTPRGGKPADEVAGHSAAADTAADTAVAGANTGRSAKLLEQAHQLQGLLQEALAELRHQTHSEEEGQVAATVPGDVEKAAAAPPQSRSVGGAPEDEAWQQPKQQHQHQRWQELENWGLYSSQQQQQQQQQQQAWQVQQQQQQQQLQDGGGSWHAQQQQHLPYPPGFAPPGAKAAAAAPGSSAGTQAGMEAGVGPRRISLYAQPSLGGASEQSQSSPAYQQQNWQQQGYVTSPMSASGGADLVSPRGPYHMIGFDVLGCPIYATAAQLQQLGFRVPEGALSTPSVLPFTRDNFAVAFGGQLPAAGSPSSRSMVPAGPAFGDSWAGATAYPVESPGRHAQRQAPHQERQEQPGQGQGQYDGHDGQQLGGSGGAGWPGSSSSGGASWQGGQGGSWFQQGSHLSGGPGPARSSGGQWHAPPAQQQWSVPGQPWGAGAQPGSAPGSPGGRPRTPAMWPIPEQDEEAQDMPSMQEGRPGHPAGQQQQQQQQQRGDC